MQPSECPRGQFPLPQHLEQSRPPCRIAAMLRRAVMAFPDLAVLYHPAFRSVPCHADSQAGIEYESGFFRTIAAHLSGNLAGAEDKHRE